MDENLNPQAEQMADESMVRNLAAQAECIWPQEKALFERYALPEGARVLDAGCGTGEITRRLAELFPGAELLGVDIVDAHLDVARERALELAPRIRFENRSVYELGLEPASVDLVVGRHVIQAIPHPERVLAELVRVARPGGRLHVLAEDYGMMRFPPRKFDSDEFWSFGPLEFGAATGCDMRIGRKTYGLLKSLGLRDVTVDYVVLDTLRAPRERFAAIWEAWRDGYAEAIELNTRFTAEEARAHFDDMIETIRDPDGYGVWFIPVIAGVVA